MTGLSNIYSAALLVFIGGGVGSVLRFLMGRIVNSKFESFPFLATFGVNVMGSLILGSLLAWVLKSQLNILSPIWLLLGVGFCGGFTTFSTFAVENIQLLKDGNILTFFSYTAGSVILGFFLAFLGFQLFK